MYTKFDAAGDAFCMTGAGATEIERLKAENADLLEALDLLVEEIKDHALVADDTIIQSKVNDARAAITKATT